MTNKAQEAMQNDTNKRIAAYSVNGSPPPQLMPGDIATPIAGTGNASLIINEGPTLEELGVQP